MKLKNFTKTIVWGDSVARGVIYDERRARYTISKQSAVRAFAAATGVEVTNRAHMGMTSVQGEEMMEKDIAKGITAEVALIGFGGNDSNFDWRAISEDPTACHEPHTPLVMYEATMRRMVKRLRGEGVEVVLSTLTPVISERYFDFCSRDGLNRKNILSWLGTKEQISRFHAGYSQAVERVAAEENCPLIDLYGIFYREKDLASLFCIDGIHPNDAGQALIAKAVLSFLASA